MGRGERCSQYAESLDPFESGCTVLGHTILIGIGGGPMNPKDSGGLGRCNGEDVTPTVTEITIGIVKNVIHVTKSSRGGHENVER